MKTIAMKTVARLILTNGFNFPGDKTTVLDGGDIAGVVVDTYADAADITRQCGGEENVREEAAKRGYDRVIDSVDSGNFSRSDYVDGYGQWRSLEEMLYDLEFYGAAI